MRLFLDDVRTPPAGYTRCYSSDEVIALLKTRDDILEISLDNDLGDPANGTPFDLLMWIELQIICEGYNPPRLKIHATNPIDVMRLNIAVKSIERLSAGHRR